MTTWGNYNMWLVKTQDNLGELSNLPVLVFDQEKHADDYIKQLESRIHEFSGEHQGIWIKTPIKVSLDVKHFQPNNEQSQGDI